jgi:agmatine deiminase
MNDADLAYWYVDSSDRNIIDQAANTEGTPYQRVNLPLTQFPVQTTSGQNVGFRSSYVNFYVGNGVVLVPEYDDPQDEVALNMIQGLYPDRTAIGINCQNMLQWGGMVHCVTQQQPLDLGNTTVPENPSQLDHGQCIKRMDFRGREIEQLTPGQPCIHLYEDGWAQVVIQGN